MMVQVSRDARSAVRSIKVCRPTGAPQNCSFCAGAHGFEVAQTQHGFEQQGRRDESVAPRVRFRDQYATVRRQKPVGMANNGDIWPHLTTEFEAEIGLWRRSYTGRAVARVPSMTTQDSMKTRHATMRFRVALPKSHHQSFMRTGPKGRKVFENTTNYDNCSKWQFGGHVDSAQSIQRIDFSCTRSRHGIATRVADDQNANGFFRGC